MTQRSPRPFRHWFAKFDSLQLAHLIVGQPSQQENHLRQNAAVQRLKIPTRVVADKNT